MSQTQSSSRFATRATSASLARAFTLIELLVVIAIIAILAAILFPVFAQARDKARQSASISNVKQIAMGHMMYMQDYDETFAPLITDNRNYLIDWQNGWMSKIFPYVKNAEVFLSPNARNRRPLQPNSPGATSGGTIFSYAMTSRWKFHNGFDPNGATSSGQWRTPFGTALYDGIGGYWQEDTDAYWGGGSQCTGATPTQRTVPSAPQAAISRPAETALVFDALTFDGGAGCLNNAPAWLDAMDAVPFAGAGARFVFAGRYSFVGMIAINGRNTNVGFGAVAFADGHVQAMRTEKFYEIMTLSSGARAYRYQYIGE